MVGVDVDVDLCPTLPLSTSWIIANICYQNQHLSTMLNLTASLEARARTLDIIVRVLQKLEQIADIVIYTSKHSKPPSSPYQHCSGQHLYISIYSRLNLYNTSNKYCQEGSKHTITTIRKLQYLQEQLDRACRPNSKPDNNKDKKEDAANWIL